MHNTNQTIKFKASCEQGGLREARREERGKKKGKEKRKEERVVGRVGANNWKEKRYFSLFHVLVGANSKFSGPISIPFREI